VPGMAMMLTVSFPLFAIYTYPPESVIPSGLAPVPSVVVPIVTGVVGLATSMTFIVSPDWFVTNAYLPDTTTGDGL
jgi:hypothetical protein